MRKIKKSGFTLIELLVVMAIIAILAAVISGSFVNSQRRSRDASRKAELRSLSSALNAYYADYGEFPEEGYVNNDLIADQGEFSVDRGGEEKIIYMKRAPNDSQASGSHEQFKYVVNSDLNAFKLYANLENEDDASCESNCLTSEYEVADGCCYVITSSNIGVEDAL